MKSDLLLFFCGSLIFYLVYNPDLSVNNKHLLYFYRKKKSFKKFYVLKNQGDMSFRFLYEISELLMIVKFKDLDNYHMTEGHWKTIQLIKLQSNASIYHLIPLQSPTASCLK